MSAELLGQTFYSGPLICRGTDYAELDLIRYADIRIQHFADVQTCPKCNRGITIALAARVCSAKRVSAS